MKFKVGDFALDLNRIRDHNDYSVYEITFVSKMPTITVKNIKDSTTFFKNPRVLKKITFERNPEYFI